jgi:hypothetical protein
VQTIRIATLKPFSPRLHGAIIGEAHAQQVRDQILDDPESTESLVLDFCGVEGASASYLKRLIQPFFARPGEADALPREIAPILVNIESTDLKEELEDYLTGKGRVLVLADGNRNLPKFRELLGHLDGAAAETFQELRTLKRSTAGELYERHREETTNQTAWNNRLAQLVEMRIARRNRVGRFWVYEPIVKS